MPVPQPHHHQHRSRPDPVGTICCSHTMITASPMGRLAGCHSCYREPYCTAPGVPSAPAFCGGYGTETVLEYTFTSTRYTTTVLCPISGVLLIIYLLHIGDKVVFNWAIFPTENRTVRPLASPQHPRSVEATGEMGEKCGRLPFLLPRTVLYGPWDSFSTRVLWGLRYRPCWSIPL